MSRKNSRRSARSHISLVPQPTNVTTLTVPSQPIAQAPRQRKPTREPNWATKSVLYALRVGILGSGLAVMAGTALTVFAPTRFLSSQASTPKIQEKSTTQKNATVGIKPQEAIGKFVSTLTPQDNQSDSSANKQIQSNMTMNGSHVAWPPLSNDGGNGEHESPKYRDFSGLRPEDVPPSPQPSARATKRRKGPKELSFPTKLHDLLTTCSNGDFAQIISWQEHGRSFVILDTKQFATRYVLYFVGRGEMEQLTVISMLSFYLQCAHSRLSHHYLFLPWQDYAKVS